MRLLVQRVARATAEVDACVEARIGQGLVLQLALETGDTSTQAQQLAAKVVKLKLWSDLENAAVQWASNVAENGFEILLVLQQSLAASLSSGSPSEGGIVMAEAGALFEAFATALRKNYEEDMIVCLDVEKDVRLEMTSEGSCMFQLDSISTANTSSVKKELADITIGDIEADNLSSVVDVLQKLPQLPKSKATLHACRVHRVFGSKKFKEALANAAEADTDELCAALDGAASLFSKKQRDQISSWTGVSVAAPEGDAEPDAPEEDEEDDAKPTDRIRPDWTGKAAPETPAVSSARAWAANRKASLGAPTRPSGKAGSKGSVKGKGRGQWRSYGIASLDEASRIHGTDGSTYEFHQLARYSDNEVHLAKKKDQTFDSEAADADPEAEGPAAKRRKLKLPKGVPTLAPMCPPPAACDSSEL